MDPQANPFAAFSLIVAPAILTNAASVLAMSTSNRLARAVDRARDLARQLEAGETSASEGAEAGTTRRLNELGATERRALMLLRVLQSFYIALGGFACATLLSLLGAVLARVTVGLLVSILEFGAVGAGAIAVAALVRGSVLLVRETDIAVRVMMDRAAGIRSRTSHPRPGARS